MYLENRMTVRKGYVPRRSIAWSVPRGTKRRWKNRGRNRVGKSGVSKDAGQSYPQMAEVCIFGGSAEGGKPFTQGSRGCNTLGRSPEAAVSGQCPEVKPLGRVQGGSACRVSRGQRPLGRVQGGNACSGVQRVKPFGPGRVVACDGSYWVLPVALRVTGAGGFAAFF